MNVGKGWWTLNESANLTASHRKKSSLTSLPQLLKTKKPKTNS